MKRTLFFICTLLCANVLLAQNWVGDVFQEGGLKYTVTSTNPPEVSVKANSTSITEANIPATITYGETTFSVTSVSNSAFQGCTYLTSVTIPNTVTSIENSAFQGCSSLTSITIPNSVTFIGNQVFWSCYGLNSVTLPEGLTSIGSFAFEGCRSLISIDIPNSVTSIGERALAICSSLTSIIIPENVTSIGYGAFYDCEYLTSVICLAETAPSLGSQGGAFNTSSNKTLTIPFNALGYTSDWGSTTWQKIYHKINVGETKILSNTFEITDAIGLINEGVLRIEQGGELVNETTTNVSGVYEIETPTLATDKWSFVGAPFNGYKLEAIKEGTRDVTVSLFDYGTGT